MMKSKIQRISVELDTILRDFAQKNDLKIVPASREIARLLNRSRGNPIVRELKF